MNKLLSFVLLVVGAFAGTIVPVENCSVAHPYHVSLTEIEFTPKTGNFEVSMCVWPADMESALSQQEKRAVNLDDERNLDQLLKNYVGSKVGFAAATNAATDLRWVGHERDNKRLWVYFEFAAKPESARQATLPFENRLFFELNEDQINQVNFRNGTRFSKTQSGQCTQSKRSVALKLREN